MLAFATPLFMKIVSIPIIIVAGGAGWLLHKF